MRISPDDICHRTQHTATVKLKLVKLEFPIRVFSPSGEKSIQLSRCKRYSACHPLGGLGGSVANGMSWFPRTGRGNPRLDRDGTCTQAAVPTQH